MVARCDAAVWQAGLLPGWLVGTVLGRDVILVPPASSLLALHCGRYSSRFNPSLALQQLLRATPAPYAQASHLCVPHARHARPPRQPQRCLASLRSSRPPPSQRAAVRVGGDGDEAGLGVVCMRTQTVGAFAHRAHVQHWRWRGWRHYFRLEGPGAAPLVKPLFISKVSHAVLILSPCGRHHSVALSPSSAHLHRVACAREASQHARHPSKPQRQRPAARVAGHLARHAQLVFIRGNLQLVRANPKLAAFCWALETPQRGMWRRLVIR
jgi:hypothetical protein